VDSREKARSGAQAEGHVGSSRWAFSSSPRRPELVRSIRARGGRIFLDVKYHDIPTPWRAPASRGQLNVDFINVHALAARP